MKNLRYAILFLLGWTICTVFASEYDQKLTELGGIITDLSGENKIKLSQPDCAYVNFSGFSQMPEAKGVDLKGWVEFFDGNGNYFKKRIIANAQGNSSMGFPKKNVSIDILEDEWIGDKTTDVTFGDWVKQDGFHLKAYYTDWFRGIGVVAYHVYDLTTSDRGDMRYPWQRAGVTSADKNARCHPDGFPCAVYLNGNFYGMFAWQLKKHRRNMGMTKDEPLHIHLDGDINPSTLFKDNPNTIDWTMFEVRNPKGLVTKRNTKYDGDAPQEIMGEGSQGYDANNPDHVLTAQVKKSIKLFSNSCYKLKKLKRSGYTTEQMRAEIEKLYDVQGMIDYIVFSIVTNNVDGWWKNWQWFTYDGVKWFVEPYDLDMTFGGLSSGFFVTPPEFVWYWWDDPTAKFEFKIGPFEYIFDYYDEDIKARYTRLRTKQILNYDNIMAEVRNWYDRVGQDNLDKDHDVWSDCWFNHKIEIAPEWKEIELYMNINKLPAWDNDKLYRTGDQVTLNWRVFEAVSENRGVNPLPGPGYHDGIDRLEYWVSRRLELQDETWLTDLSDVKDLSSDEDRMQSEGQDMIFDILGRRLSHPVKGLNIINGKKVLLQ